MTGILRFKTRAGGYVSVNVDEGLLHTEETQIGANEFVEKGLRKGYTELQSDLVMTASKTFEESLESLKAYADGISDVIDTFALQPNKVIVEIGLTVSGTAGFIIANASAETAMKVTLSWEPKKTFVS